MANNSVKDATRLLLQTSANMYYRGLPEASKKSVRSSFFAADKQGAGKISFRDFLKSGLTVQLQNPARVGLFRFLDADGTGFLELDEFIMLHYINESGIIFCSSCGIPIIIGGYSCTSCPPAGGNSFDVCLSCYSSPVMHQHPQTSFVNLVANFQQRGASNTSFKSTMPRSHNMTKEAAHIDETGFQRSGAPNNAFLKSTMPSHNMTREAVHIDESGLSFTCDCCSVIIVTDRYTCKECVKSFDLCPSCYSSPPQYFRHHHPYSSFMRTIRSQTSTAAAEAAAAVAAMNASIAMNTNMAAAAMNASIAMNADMAAAAAMNAMTANMAAMGHQPAQGNNNFKAGLDFLANVANLSMQAGLFN